MTNTKQYRDAVFTFTITAEQQRVIDTMTSPHIDIRNAHKAAVSSTGEIDVVDVIDDTAVISYQIETDGTHTAQLLDDFGGGWLTITDENEDVKTYV